MTTPGKVEPHYTLKEAVARFFPDGSITVSALRTEYRAGRLQITPIAGKFLVTERAIIEMLEACRQCRAAENHRDSTSGHETDARRSGLSKTERLRSARAVIETMLTGPRPPSRDTLPPTTKPPASRPSPISTSTK